ncbi:DsbA family protein [Erythrobacter sp. YJ-T3-07]|uniref:thioredoxin domain-containing protein n=1 Tax=Erythrobacter sp. YJ-T3-07 TaxID=2793063 RepID=UPI0018D28565|nr:thioredoxin domain-containing protein [Erythrobacter sp. YJ-T3-07]MBH1943376.1 DsbA family protein [Erythrobacter sp. YJ-T3-07]
MTRIMGALLLMLAGLASPAAAQSWLQTVERTPVSHIVGNPDAPVTVIEYLSYTCPHCREFAMQGEEILKLGYVSKGDLRYEYRDVAANPVDLTAAMMARCGAPEKFPGNHSALMMAQPQYNALMRLATKAQSDRWFNGDKAARRRAVASDLNLYAIFERRGYTRVELDRCLADQALADRIEGAIKADVETYGPIPTPSFVVNGTMLEGVHTWDQLQQALAGAGTPGASAPPAD